MEATTILTRGAGKEVFEKGLSAMFTLAGTIVGYLFGVTKSARSSPSSVA